MWFLPQQLDAASYRAAVALFALVACNLAAASIKNCQPEITMLPAGPAKLCFLLRAAVPSLPSPARQLLSNETRTGRETERPRDQGEIYAQVVFCKSYGLIITTWQCLQ